MCAALDLVAATAGGVLLVIVVVDSATSWPSQRVLLDHRHLSQVAGAILGPCWIWLFASLFVAVGFPSGRRFGPPKPQDLAARARDDAQRMMWRLMYRDQRLRGAIALAAVLSAGVVIGGFIVGAAKGNARILPGPLYEVSVFGLNGSAWTPVSASQYSLWQAQFVRMDGFFTLFGLALFAGSLGLFQLHRAVTVQTISLGI